MVKAICFDYKGTMPEKTKQNKDLPEETEKLSEEQVETGEKSSLEEDQKRRSYYYDDACGYEIYNPETDETDDE